MYDTIELYHRIIPCIYHIDIPYLVIADCFECYNREKSNTSMSTPSKPHRPPPPFEPPTLPYPKARARGPLFPDLPSTSGFHHAAASASAGNPAWVVPQNPTSSSTATFQSVASSAVNPVWVVPSSSTATYSSGMATADKILDHHNLTHEYYCKNNTEPDGNCFFHAIADQLTDPQIMASVGAPRARNIPIDHLIIRQRVADFARRSQEVLEDQTILAMLQVMETNDPYGRDMFTIWREYVREMRQPGKWASELIVRVTAIYFGKNLRAIKEDFVAIWHGGDLAVDPPMAIVNMGECHFQSVHRRPVSDR